MDIGKILDKIKKMKAIINDRAAPEGEKEVAKLAIERILKKYPDIDHIDEIEEEVVAPGTVAMWWLGCTGLWVKTPGDANICIDFWLGNGKRTKKTKNMVAGHQMANMCGCRLLQPNLRASPFVMDPFAVRKVDAVLSTHYHNDHIDVNYAAAVLKNVAEPIPFIGPKKSVDMWLKWGVPEDRCIVVRPGDSIKIKDLEIIAVDSFDRTCLVTADENIRGVLPEVIGRSHPVTINSFKIVRLYHGLFIRSSIAFRPGERCEPPPAS